MVSGTDRVNLGQDHSETADREIAGNVMLRLATSAYLPLRRIHCECSGGVLTLAGSVPSFFHRQMAQAHVREVAGVSQINDQLQVPHAN